MYVCIFLIKFYKVTVRLVRLLSIENVVHNKMMRQFSLYNLAIVANDLYVLLLLSIREIVVYTDTLIYKYFAGYKASIRIYDNFCQY